MRCLACDCELSDREATRKSVVTKEYIDLCDGCFSHISDVVLTTESIYDLETLIEEMDE